MAAALIASLCPMAEAAAVDPRTSISAPPAHRARGAAVSVWDGTTRTPVTPSAAGVYTITNAAEFAWIFSNENDKIKDMKIGDVIEIKADIDLDWHEWTPVQARNVSITGNGHVVRGLRISAATGDAGLFASVGGDRNSISDLHFTDVDINVRVRAGRRDVGTIIGSQFDGGELLIEGCSAEGRITVDGSACVGGLAGYVYTAAPGASIAKSAADMTIIKTGASDIGRTDAVGGIVGYVIGPTRISDCAASGSISAQAAWAGGIVGRIISDGRDSVVMESTTNFADVELDISLEDGSMQCGVGGIVGSCQPDARSAQPENSSLANFGGVAAIGSSSSSGRLEISAGGIVGLLSMNDDGSDDSPSISKSANLGTVTNRASGSVLSSAGGIVGRVIGDPSGPSRTFYAKSVRSEGGETKIICASGTAGGLVGAAQNADLTFDDCSSNMLPSGESGDWLSVATPAAKPSDLDEYRATSAISAKGTKNADGSISLKIFESPNVEVRDDSSTTTYSVSPANDTDPPFDSAAKIVGRTITVTTPPFDDDQIRLSLTASTIGQPIVRSPLTATFVFGEKKILGEIVSIRVTGLPVTPTTDAEHPNGIPLQFEWIDSQGRVRYSSLPQSVREVKWRVLSPAGSKWPNVGIDGSGAFATLRIGAPSGETKGVVEEHRIAVEVVVSDAAPIVYERSFLVGEFLTPVPLAGQAESIVDATNADLAKTGVSVIPGNFNRPIPQHMLDMLSERLGQVVTYGTGTSAASRADGEQDIFAIEWLGSVERYALERPDEASIPICFESSKKDGANIAISVSENSEIGGVEGKIALLPMTYSVTFSAEEMTRFFGDAASSVLASPNSDESLAKIFSVLVIHKRIKEGGMEGWYTRLVDGVSPPREARDLGMLSVTSRPDDRTLTVTLAYSVIDWHGEAFVLKGEYDQTKTGDVAGYMIIPDGLNNGKIVDPLWSNIWAASRTDRPSGGSGGSGGCEVGGASVALLVIALATRKKYSKNRKS